MLAHLQTLRKGVLIIRQYGDFHEKDLLSSNFDPIQFKSGTDFSDS